MIKESFCAVLGITEKWESSGKVLRKRRLCLLTQPVNRAVSGPLGTSFFVRAGK